MTRLQLRLTGPAEDLFNGLAETLRSSQKDIVLDALALLHYAVEQVQTNRKVGSYDPSSREFTAMTTSSLEALAARAKKGTSEKRSAVAGA